ncbi:hypothetical protein B0H16DRAFT_1890850 [Mycena metata]|uniref:F-box domain-containing protein n=1 Tax=Mycena metata TaxID=1033252 RepID=A0AAD7ICM7_9AGAR|nr:hypothetical protein B0H16DRAFT_1890850 [Mycena metata]
MRPPSTSNDVLRAHASSLDSAIVILQVRTQSDNFSGHQELNDLLTARAAVQAELDAITYDVLTLPVEIVAQIFCWTLVLSRLQLKSTSRQEPWRLGQICRLWREIALSTPQLWNTIEIIATPHISYHYDERIRTFLSRAGSLPLAISFTFDDRGDFFTDYTAPMSRSLATIVPYSHAWEEVSLCNMTAASLDTLQLVHHPLPLLKSLGLDFRTRPYEGKLGTAFNDAPLLWKVDLHNFGSQPFALLWAQSTSLNIGACTSSALADTLKWTPALVNLRIGTGVMIHAPLPLLPSLPHLRSLVFPNLLPNPSLQKHFLSHLDVHLRQLKIAVINMAHFPLPLAHPASLEELSVAIKSEVLAGPSLLEDLATSSALRALKIIAERHQSNAATFLLRPLIYRLTHDPEFLPRLESLTIIILEQPASEHLFDRTTLSGMLGARCPSTGGPLRYFELRSRRGLPGLDQQVQKLAEIGTEIILETDPNLAVSVWSTEF